MRQEQEIRQVFLMTTSSQVETDMLLDILEQQGIIALAKADQAGSGLDPYMGGSVYGDDIYVDESDYEEAKELAEAYFAEIEEDGE